MHDGAEPLSPVLPSRRNWPHAIARFVSSAPVTFSWLTVLLMTTVAQHVLPRWHLIRMLRNDSTNLHHLASDPLRVLGTSLLWLDGYRWWWLYLLVFCVFLAPAERWLGSLRFVLVGLIAHVVATYLSEGFLYWQIQESMVSPRYLNARDVGVSYVVVGIIGVLTYAIPRRWRLLYLVGALGWFAGSVALHPTFTSVGHLAALLIGLALYPVTPRRRHAAA